MDLLSYGLVINFLGLLVYATGRRSFAAGWQVMLGLLGVAGAAPVLMLAFWIWDRKAEKETMLLRLQLLCFFLLQVLALFSWKLGLEYPPDWAFWKLFYDRPVALYYLAAINLITFAVFGWDKWMAQRNGRRVRITSLLGLAFLGGSPAALAAMLLFRHKIRKLYFTFGVPVIFLTQLAFLLFLAKLQP